MTCPIARPILQTILRHGFDACGLARAAEMRGISMVGTRSRTARRAKSSMVGPSELTPRDYAPLGGYTVESCKAPFTGRFSATFESTTGADP